MQKKYYLAICYLLPLTSMIGYNSSKIGLSIGNLYLYRLLTITFLLINIYIIITSKNYNLRLKKPLTITTILLFLTAVSLSWSMDINEGISEIVSILFFFLNLLIFSTISKHDYVLFHFSLSVAIAYTTSFFVVIWELMTGNHITDDFEGINSIELIDLPRSFFTNPNDLGVFINLCTPFFYFLINSFEGKIKKNLINTFFVLTAIFQLIISQSRLSILIFAIILIYTTLKTQSSIFKATTLFITAILFIILGSTDDLYIHSLVDKLTNFTSELGSNSGSINIRLNLLKNSFIALSETYGFGLGAGSFELWNTYNSSFINQTYGFYNPHSLLAEIISQYGILFTILFLWLVISPVIKADKDRKNKLYLTLLIFTYIASSFGPSTFLTYNFGWQIIIALSISSEFKNQSL